MSVVLLKTFYLGTAAHEMGIECSINNLEFDALFDTGSDYAHLKPDLMDEVRDRFPAVTDMPPGYPPMYLVPLTIHSVMDSPEHSRNTNHGHNQGQNHSLSHPCIVYEGDENRIPPRIFTGDYSINFAQAQVEAQRQDQTQPNKETKNYVTFKPKQSAAGAGEFDYTYETLFNKKTWMTMPIGTPGFYFSIGGNLETALFDTGSLINVVDPSTADKIGIEKYLPAEDFFGFGPLMKCYLVPISLPGVVSFVAPAYVYDQPPMNIMNVVSAAQFLDNGIEFTLHKHSASFSNLGDRERNFSSWIIRTMHA
jgi:hypothetical protein